MSIYKETTELVGLYKGTTVIGKVYKGTTEVFSAYSVVSGSLPLTFNNSAQHVLKNYVLYGSASGAGVETESGEPAGYKITLTNTSGQNTDTYPLYIGSTKLYEDEYVDYESGKVWKMVDGTLTPTDPPDPLPAITAYKGENTLSSAETVGTVTVTGRIHPAYKTVEYIKSDGTQIIVTDIVANSTCKYELDLKFGSAGADAKRSFFGAIEIQNNSLVTRFSANWGEQSNTSFYAYLFESSTASQTVLSSSSIRTSRNVLSLALATRTYGSETLASPASTLPTTMTLPLALFGVVEGATVSEFKPFAQSDMYLYSFKIYDANDNVTHNLIPVERQSDSAVGLYDTATGKFYGNNGTGSFSKGAYTN